jgi:hypothetical protein
MGDLFLKRTLHGFAAADEATQDAMRSYKIGDTYRASVVKPRNLKAHRRYWALVNMVYQNTEGYASAELVHAHLKLLAGRCSPVVSKTTGETFLVPESISFNAMDEAEFQDFWARCIKAVCEHIIPGIEVDAVQYEIERVLGVAA